MTETQAKAGAADSATKPDDDEAAESGTPATARAAVGRATVPGDASSPSLAEAPVSGPRFTRAPGMAPPPTEPLEVSAPSSGAPSIGGSPIALGPAGGVGTVTAPITLPTMPGAPVGPRMPGAEPGEAPIADGLPPRDGTLGPAGRFGPGGPAGPAVGAARVSDAARAPRTASARGPRRARLSVKRVDPWSVMKFSAAVSFVLFIVIVVATSVLYLALDQMGVWASINNTLAEMVGASGGTGEAFRITARGVIFTSGVVAAVNIVLFTSLTTLGAFIYNVCADLVGGIELTLAERD